MSVDIRMRGFKELANSIAKLPKEMRDGVERTALRTGAKPVEKKARALVPVSSGLLKKSIGITVKKNRKGDNKGNLSARIGARTGFKQTEMIEGKSVEKDPVKYAHFVEYGTSRKAAKPFIRPAAESSRAEVLDGMAKGYEKGLARVVKKIKAL